MNAVLEGFPEILCTIDDIHIFGKDNSQHDERSFAALERTQQAGVTLNTEKCEFWCNKLTFLISKNGISPDCCYQGDGGPVNVTELHRFMGIVSLLGVLTLHCRIFQSPQGTTEHKK